MSDRRLTEVQARRREVARLVLAGVGREEIAKHLGISRHLLTNDVFHARQDGLIPEFKRAEQPVQMARRMQQKIDLLKVSGGTMYSVYGALTPEVQDWLLCQAPEGSSLAETIAAIITDAYFEENPDE